ncbi:hypothetical protein Bbelb_167100 [Branchiostoma belcheri]|nr:hypothetical protein Bbelb_167100 [Branchiostoma belcheri]
MAVGRVELQTCASTGHLNNPTPVPGCKFGRAHFEVSRSGQACLPGPSHSRPPSKTHLGEYTHTLTAGTFCTYTRPRKGRHWSDVVKYHRETGIPPISPSADSPGPSMALGKPRQPSKSRHAAKAGWQSKYAGRGWGTDNGCQ